MQTTLTHFNTMILAWVHDRCLLDALHDLFATSFSAKLPSSMSKKVATNLIRHHESVSEILLGKSLWLRCQRTKP